MRFIVTVDWSIGITRLKMPTSTWLLLGAVDDSILNLVYNLADKIAFELVIMLSEVHGH